MILIMDKKQKEALIVALAEKGATYREITKRAGVSPNTIKAVLNRAGLDETTSISSRAFELYVQQKTPLDVTIALNLEAEDAIKYYKEFLMLLGITEFTKVYLLVKDNPIQFVNLFKLSQNLGMGDGEVAELLKIANGYLPRVRFEYDRVKNELNSWKAEISNAARIYQQFCDRNLALKNREDELQLSVNDLEIKENELQKTIRRLEQHISVLENNVNTANLNPEVNQEDIILTNDELIPSLNCHKNENEMPDYHFQSESSYRKLIFDTKDLF